MRIGSREVGPNAPVFIIAECGSNHGGSLDAALALIDAAAEAGADAAKFQRFRVDSFLVPRPNPEALRPYELPDEWLPKLRARCDERGIEFLCTAFDEESFDVVEPFVGAYKIGSYEAMSALTVLATLRSRATHKPIIASNGRSDDWSVRELANGCIVLVCQSRYPALVDGYLKNLIPDPWGVSDHTLDPLTVPCAAVALGACVVEKHMMGYYDRMPREYQAQVSAGVRWPDWNVSIVPADFADMVNAIRATESAVRG